MARKPLPHLGLPDFITLAAAMQRSGFGRSFLYERMASGEIEARKVGGSIRIVTASLDAFLNAAPRAVHRRTPRAAKQGVA